MWSVPSRRSECSTSVMIQRREPPRWFGSSSNGIKNFVARTMSSRRPFRALPTISSLSPWEYTSAVSTKLTPASRARWMMRMLSSWSLVPQAPNIMVPRHNLLTWTPVRPSGRSSIVAYLSGWNDVFVSCHEYCSRVDRGVHVGCGLAEGDLTFHPARSDPPRASGHRPPVPRVVRAIGGAHVQLTAGSHDPHRHVRAQAAVTAAGGQLQLLGLTHPAQLVIGPSRHGWISTFSALRSAIARYPSGTSSRVTVRSKTL